MQKEICFRCDTILEVTKTLDKITFYKCEECKRAYAKSKGKSLTDRWLSPISIAIYEIIFEKEKVSNAMIEELASGFLDRFTEQQLKIFITDIDEEINHPKQKLVDMLTLKGSEEVARDYLRRLSKEIKTRL